MSEADPGWANRFAERQTMGTLPDADLRGMIGPGVVPGGERNQGARRDALEGSPVLLPPVPTHRPLAGADQNFRGNTRLVTIDPNVVGGFPRTNLASIVMTPPSCGDDAETITVSCGLQYNAADTSDPVLQMPIALTGNLEWGIGGASFSAEFDWLQGTTFAIPASFVRVGATLGAIPPLAIPPLTLAISAGLSYHTTGAGSTSCTIRRTVLLDNLGGAPPGLFLNPGATSPLFFIPAWANAVTLTQLTVTQPTLRINLFTDTTFATASHFEWVSNQNTAGQRDGQFPIPDGMKLFSVTNIGLAPAFAVRAVFDLAF